MKGSYLGPNFDEIEIEKQLISSNAKYSIFSEDELLEIVTDDLANGMAVGWFQGRMEFGPRALGSRSILADPRSETMQKNLNLKVKFRESFRPFAPSILEDDLSDWFDIDEKSPYMLFVSNINESKTIRMGEKENHLFGIKKLNIKRSEIPAVTHVDYSARIQTVNSSTNRKYYNLLKKFKEKTNCPILVNTSFNIRGEPIVNTPAEAFNCFMGTNLDRLVIGNFYMTKENQNIKLKKDYKDKFELD